MRARSVARLKLPIEDFQNPEINGTPTVWDVLSIGWFIIFPCCLSRSGFKTSDKVQGQGIRQIGKAQHTWVCEHLPEAYAAP
jgi:hypothetical protein